MSIVREFTIFAAGQKLRILEDRRECWQSDEEFTVSAVHNHGFKRGVGHPQSLTMTNGEKFSGWWFDPKTVCLWKPDKDFAAVNRRSPGRQIMKRWLPDEDMFIHAYLDAVGSMIGPRNLNRSEKSVRDRAKKLRAIGAWDALTRLHNAEKDYFKSLGLDDADVCLATIRRTPVTSGQRRDA